MPASNMARPRGASDGARPDLTDFGISLRHRKAGEHRLACPECARSKARPRDDALAVKVEHDGHAFWLCHRCRWKGSTTAPGASPASDRAPAPAVLPERPAAFPARLWRSCRPILPGTVAADYLQHRACALPHPEGDLRWHPELHHPSGHAGPGLVALVTDAVTAEPLTVHRTWVAADGTGKAAIDKPRLLWPGLPKAGGVVRLWPDPEVITGLCLGEGLETVLTAALGFGHAWSAIDAGNLAVLPVLDGIESLTIVADHDEPGIKAADALGQRWLAAGREVRVWCSDRCDEDLNDVVGRAVA